MSFPQSFSACSSRFCGWVICSYSLHCSCIFARASAGTYSPQLVESVHVERQVIQFAFIIGNRRVGVSVELNKPVHIIPYFPVVCMKNMCTVFMHVDAVYFFAVDIATGVWTFLYHQTSLSGFMSLMGKHARTGRCLQSGNRMVSFSFSVVFYPATKLHNYYRDCRKSTGYCAAF